MANYISDYALSVQTKHNKDPHINRQTSLPTILTLLNKLIGLTEEHENGRRKVSNPFNFIFIGPGDTTITSPRWEI